MKKLLFLVVAVVACAGVLAQPTQAAVTKQTVVPCRQANTDCWPAAFAFQPNNGDRVWYAERYTGQIRVYNRATQTDERWLTVRNIAMAGEQGLLGLALDPRWPDRKWVYVYYTHNGGEAGDAGIENRVVRIRKHRGQTQRQQLLTVSASDNHNGGVIHFGPDGKLYVVTGENYNAGLSQDLTSNAGKVLRINKNGSVPSDNPFADSPVFSYGHRNSFGFTFNPFADEPEVWMTENGPACNDELNVATGGENFGWGSEAECPDTNQSGSDPVAATYTWESVIAPTGMVFCDACRLGFGDAAQRTVLVGSWNDANILNVTLLDGRTTVDTVETLYQNDQGILAMAAGPQGRAFFSDRYGIYRLANE